MTAAGRRSLLRRLVLVLVGLVTLWSVAGFILARQLGARRDATVAGALAGVLTVFEAAQEDMRREARLLAQDPAVVEGATRSDWATLARGASPRMLALTLARLVDLLLVVDASGAPLLQVPATPRIVTPAVARPAATVARLGVIDERAYVLGVAPLPVGLVVVGRRFESLGGPLARLPSRPALVVLAGDRALGSTLPGVPATGWDAATRAGWVTIKGEAWVARPVAEAGGSLWALVSDREHRGESRRHWFWWVASLAGAAAIAVGIAVVRQRRAPRRDTPAGRRSRELEALHAVAVAVGSSDDLAVTAERTLEVVCGVARMDSGGLFRLDPAAQTLTLTAHRGLLPDDIERLRVRPIDGSHVGEAVRSGRLVVTDLTASGVLTPELRERVRVGGYKTQLALPVPVNGETWGVMALISKEARTFGADELTLLQAVSHQVGQAVARAGLFAETREKSRRLETLTRLAQTLGATLAPDEVFQRVVDAAVELFGSSVARLWLVDDDGQHVSLRASAGTKSSVEGVTRFRIGEGLVGTVVATREPLTVADVLGDPRARNVERIRAEGSVTVAIVPLQLSDRVLGALSVGVRARHEYTPEDMRLLASLALHAANAIHNAQLFTEEHARRAHFAALLEINKKIGGVTPTDALLSSIAEEAARLLDVDNAGFRLVDGDELVLAGLAGAAAQTMIRPRIKVGESLSGKVVTSGRALNCEIGSVPDMVPEHQEADRRLGYTTFLGVPLRVADRTLGVLTFRARRPFTARDQEIAEAFAGQAAIALEHSRLYREATRQAQRMTALADLARLMSETLEFDVAARRVADSVCELLGARSSCLYRIDPASEALVAIAASRDAGQVFQWTEVLPKGTGIAGLAVRERGPVASADVLADARLTYTDETRARVEAEAHRALLAVPLLVRGRMFGALAVCDQAGRRFDEPEIRLAQAFADQAALALENARLYSEATRQAQRMTALADLGRLLSETLDPDVVGQRIADSVRVLLAAHASALYRLDTGSEALVAFAVSGEAGVTLGRNLVFPKGIGVVGLALRERGPVATPDLFADPRLTFTEETRARIEAAGHRSVLAVPLLVGERAIGALAVGDHAGRRFDEPEIRLAQAFADQAALALENARLYREAREHADRLAALEEVNRLVSSSLKTEEVLHNIAAAVARFFDAPYVSVWVLDPTSRRIKRSLTYGDASVASELTEELELGQGAVGWVALHREPILWADAQEDPRVIDRPVLAHGLRFLTAYPIAIGDRVLGAFAVHRTAPSPVTPETTALLGSLAAQAAVALDHARLYTETTRRLEEAGALLEVLEILNSTLDATQLLKRAAIKIAQVCRVDRCSLELWEGGQIIPLMSQYADGRKVPTQWESFRARGDRLLLDVPSNRLARETRRPVVVNDTSDDPLAPREWVEAFSLKSYMVVPMIRQDEVIGVMTLDYCERPTPFQSWQVDLAMTIAGQLSLSLENTRLYTEAQERLGETTALFNVAQILSRPGQMDDLMRRVAREVAHALGADTVGVSFLDVKKEALVPLGGYHIPKDLLETFMRKPIVLARVPGLMPAWREGRAVWSPDPRTDPRFDPEWVGALPAHSVLFGSATAHGGLIGGLFAVWWQTGRQFRPADIRLIEGVAAQVGLAMENAELARQTQAKLRETETLLSVSQAMSTTLDLQALLRHFLRRVATVGDADSAGVWMLSEDERWLEPIAGYHVPPELLERLREVRIEVVTHPFCAEAIRTRRPVFSKDAAGDSRIPEVARTFFRHQSQLFVPIIAKERVIGGFSLVWLERPREFSDGELALMQAIANQAGVALENARLFEENRRQVEELSVLHELSRAVTGQLDRAALLEAIRTQVARVLDARNMVIVLRDEERQELEAALRVQDGALDERPLGRYPVRSVGLISVVVETGEAIRTDDYLGECARRGVEPVAVSAPLRHWLGVPMVAGDTVLGVLALRGRERAFTEADERLLTNIAHLAALALRSARLFEERTRAYQELAAAQDQLVRTEKLRALGEMASGVAHDFNNLLASILGRAQLTLQRLQDPQLRQWLQVIERAALDGAQTVRRLQEFTRIRRDQPFVVVDLNQVVRDALEITQSRWRDEPVSRGVAIDVRTSFGLLPKVAGDPGELREAMTNLILNAVDAMPAGGVLTLTTAVEDNEVVVVVADSGVGIPEAIRDRIFDPFFTTKGPQGTGLGLSMTYGILSRHGARLAVESREGRGTTFRLAFTPGMAVEAEEAAPVTRLAAPGVSLRCLVVDDEEEVGAVLGDVLESGGHQVVVLADGGEAIARFSAEPFDVVFTDLAMPRVSGWQVARAVKEMAPSVPVVLVTGFGVELADEERRAQGVDLVLVKPLKIGDVLDVVARAARWRDPQP